MAAFSMSMLGLVMLFSAGAVKGAQSLLTKQLIWLGMSALVFLYAVFMDLNWLRQKGWILYCFCLLALFMVLVPVPAIYQLLVRLSVFQNSSPPKPKRLCEVL